jgi:FtsH-binding integral membrane protein
VVVLIFVVIGRSAHDHGVTASGMAGTSWPFLVGLAAGWVVARTWRRPLELVPTALLVTVTCVAVGMVLRVVSGQGTAVAFVLVAVAFLGTALLGWRALARLAVARRDRRG